MITTKVSVRDLVPIALALLSVAILLHPEHSPVWDLRHSHSETSHRYLIGLPNLASYLLLVCGHWSASRFFLSALQKDICGASVDLAKCVTLLSISVLAAFKSAFSPEFIEWIDKGFVAFNWSSAEYFAVFAIGYLIISGLVLAVPVTKICFRKHSPIKLPMRLLGAVLVLLHVVLPLPATYFLSEIAEADLMAKWHTEGG